MGADEPGEGIVVALRDGLHRIGPGRVIARVDAVGRALAVDLLDALGRQVLVEHADQPLDGARDSAVALAGRRVGVDAGRFEPLDGAVDGG